MPPTRQLLFSLLASLSHQPRWYLTRVLHSNNPTDIQGKLYGTATFTPLGHGTVGTEYDLIYSEEGEMPISEGRAAFSGLRWSKNYIWRLSEGKVSVWFTKVPRGESITGEEADYLFHEFDFDSFTDDLGEKNDIFVAPPEPSSSTAADTMILMARGSHLCVNDTYQTAYAFRVDRETGKVLSWASRHAVKGPRKDQDIVNFYRPEG